MTGWRIGWSIAPRALTRSMAALQSHTTSNASTSRSTRRLPRCPMTRRRAASTRWSRSSGGGATRRWLPADCGRRCDRAARRVLPVYPHRGRAPAIRSRGPSSPAACSRARTSRLFRAQHFDRRSGSASHTPRRPSRSWRGCGGSSRRVYLSSLDARAQVCCRSDSGTASRAFGPARWQRGAVEILAFDPPGENACEDCRSTGAVGGHAR